MGVVGFFNAAVATHLPRNPRVCVFTYTYVYGICIWGMHMGVVGFFIAAVATHLPRNPRICVLTYIYIHIHIYIWDMYMGYVYGRSRLPQQRSCDTSI